MVHTVQLREPSPCYAIRRTILPLFSLDTLMRILFLTHAFNSLSQRLFLELTERGHDVSIEFDINDAVTAEAVELFAPGLIVAPFLKRAIPEHIWRRYVCFVVHPGVVGDRGSSALDWAIMNDESEWGVTVLQATGEMDAGDIWAFASFPMRSVRKSSLYRNEVTEAATRAVLNAVERFETGTYRPQPLNDVPASVRGCSRPSMAQAMRAIDWSQDATATVLKKIRAADGFPGVLDSLFGEPYLLYGAHQEDGLRGRPDTIIAQRHGAICRATVDGAVWITHLKKRLRDEKTYKLPAATVLGEQLRDVPESQVPLDADDEHRTYTDIRYEEFDGVGYLHFDFYNGAMSTDQCFRLREAYQYACSRDTRVIALMGGSDFWSNGIHLNTIEVADSPADESWRNINAMNDLARAVITTDTHFTLSALQGNAGAGGTFLALAADRIYARRGIILNPHYKGMGNLYGSEYWTYLLPRRVGQSAAQALTENRLPIRTDAAKALGLIDDCLGDSAQHFREQVAKIAQQLAASPDFERMLQKKKARRARDEREKPLAQYRTEEMERMKLNFYGFDPSYHVARYNFVHKVPHSWTPLYLAKHRRRGNAVTRLQQREAHAS